MKKSLLSFSLFLLALSLYAQSNLDSLYGVWQDEQHSDSLRLDAYKTYIWDAYLFSKPDTAFLLCEAMIAFGEERKYPQAVYQAYTLQSIAYDLQGEFSKAMLLTEQSIEGNTALGNKAGLAEAEIVMGVLFQEQGIYPQALIHFNKALVINEEINNLEGMAMCFNNIGNIYNSQGNSSAAVENYKKALAIDEELGIKQGVAVETSNIGDIYAEQGNISQAFKYYERSRDLNQEIGDIYGLSGAFSSIGRLYEKEGQLSLALDAYEKALSLVQEVGMMQEIAIKQTDLGRFYLLQGDHKKAMNYCQKAYTTSKENGAILTQNSACECLYSVNKEIGDQAEALSFFEEMAVLKDSIYNDDNTRKLTQIQMKYEFSKQEAARQAEQDKKDALAQEELQRQKLVRNSFMGGFAVVLMFAGVFLSQRNRIGKEKQRSEALLLNILPEETALELKEKGSADAKLIDEVSVLFTDFKGFTAMSEQLSPKELVQDLHQCFSLFDEICEKHGVEKIKTIGDAYMAAGGLPSPNNTHAKDVVLAALEMAEVVEKGKHDKIAKNLPYFEVRVGVHTGPVVAGIVGVKKFQYDIWGDTVNTASRMESSGEVGKVNLSQSTYQLLKDNKDFTFESRGKIKAKGKGEIEMYFVRASNERL